MNNNTKVKRITNFISKKIDNEYVVFHVESGKVYELNPTAETIWKYLWKPRTIGQLIKKITETYEVDKQKARSDIFELLSNCKNNLFRL